MKVVAQSYRNDMKDFIEEEGPIMKNYYGYYHQKPEKFKFVAGERTLIRYLVEYVKQENPQHWSCLDPVEGSVKSLNERQTEKIDLKKAEKDLRTLVSKKIEVLSENLITDAADLFKRNLDVTVKTNGTQYLAETTCPVCQVAKLKKAIIRMTKIISTKLS